MFVEFRLHTSIYAAASVSVLTVARPAGRCECVLEIRNGERTLCLVCFSEL